MKKTLVEDSGERIAGLRRAGCAICAVGALAFGSISIPAQTSTIASSTNQPNPSMKQFALLFRQTPRPLTEADQKRRAEEVRAWSLLQNSQGRRLNPHILAGESRRIQPDAESRPVLESKDSPLIAITFLEAADFAEAARIAESHPGLRYGVSIEVRPSSLPPALRAAKEDRLEKSDASLQQTVIKFIEAADQSDSATVASMYSPDFVNVRITDAGDVVRLDRDQLLSILGRAGGHHIPTKSTTIQDVELVGDTGFVLLTRIKDIGNGWEPMFYSLVWNREGEKWLLLREFVHQRSLPKSREQRKE